MRTVSSTTDYTDNNHQDLRTASNEDPLLITKQHVGQYVEHVGHVRQYVGRYVEQYVGQYVGRYVRQYVSQYVGQYIDLLYSFNYFLCEERQ